MDNQKKKNNLIIIGKTILLHLIKNIENIINRNLQIYKHQTQVPSNQIPHSNTIMDNHLQIFSFKSNLIANTRASTNLGHSKNTNANTQSRMKSLCFSNMLQNIKNNYGRDKFEQKSSNDIEKENNTMVVQAKNFKVAYGHQTPLIVQPPRATIPQSRSFLIRSHHRKTVTSSSEIKGIQDTKTVIECPSVGMEIFLKSYNFESAKELAVNMGIIWKKNHVISQHHHLHAGRPELSVLISSNLIKTQGVNLHQAKSIFENLRNKNISIYIIASSKQRAYKMHNVEQLSEYCHIIFPQTQHIFTENGNQASLKNKQIFMDLNSLNSSQLSNNLLLIQSNANHHPINNNTSIRQNCLYFPYLSHERENSQHFLSFEQSANSIFASSNLNSYAVAFIKVNDLSVIKSIWVEHSLSHDSITTQANQSKIDLSLNTFEQKKTKIQVNCQINTKKPQLIEHIYPLKSIVKLYLQSRQRLRYKTSHSHSHSQHHHSVNLIVSSNRQNAAHSTTTFSIPVNQMEGLHQKLIEYSKLRKKQLQYSSQVTESNPSKVHLSQQQQNGNNVSNPLSIINLKKEQRKSLNSKSTYQQINELIRNNISINKQIFSFVNQTKDICLKEVNVTCDNVSYYLIQ